MVKVVTGQKGNYLNFESGLIENGKDVVVPFKLTGTDEDVFYFFETWGKDAEGRNVRSTSNEFLPGSNTKFVRPILYDGSPVTITISKALNGKIKALCDTINSLGNDPQKTPLEFVVRRVGTRPIDVRYDVQIGKAEKSPGEQVQLGEAEEGNDSPLHVTSLSTNDVRNVIIKSLLSAKPKPLEANEDSIKYLLKWNPVLEGETIEKYGERIKLFIGSELRRSSNA